MSRSVRVSLDCRTSWRPSGRNDAGPCMAAERSISTYLSCSCLGGDTLRTDGSYTVGARWGGGTAYTDAGGGAWYTCEGGGGGAAYTDGGGGGAAYTEGGGGGAATNSGGGGGGGADVSSTRSS